MNTCIWYQDNGARCRKRARWIVDGYWVCNDHKASVLAIAKRAIVKAVTS